MFLVCEISDVYPITKPQAVRQVNPGILFVCLSIVVRGGSLKKERKISFSFSVLVCVCIHVCVSVCRGQKGALDSLELDL